jgi:hypothetical protein
MSSYWHHTREQMGILIMKCEFCTPHDKENTTNNMLTPSPLTSLKPCSGRACSLCNILLNRLLYLTSCPASRTEQDCRNGT